MRTHNGSSRAHAGTMPLRLGALLAVAALVGSTSAGAASRTAVPGGVATGPLSAESNREYTTMVATRYQHHNQESEVDHTYFYDCVGFVSYAMSRAAPTASATTRDTLKIKKGFVPSPARYVSLFD